MSTHTTIPFKTQSLIQLSVETLHEYSEKQEKICQTTDENTNEWADAHDALRDAKNVLVSESFFVFMRERMD